MPVVHAWSSELTSDEAIVLVFQMKFFSDPAVSWQVFGVSMIDAWGIEEHIIPVRATNLGSWELHSLSRRTEEVVVVPTSKSEWAYPEVLVQQPWQFMCTTRT